jgi:5-methylcytosine-specific restriction endonuclease McrA
MSVFVVDKHKKPLMPCSEKRARLLLSRKQAVVDRRFPFTIRLKYRTVVESSLQEVRVKIDPGSKTTGVAIVREEEQTHHVLALMEIIHRGFLIKDSLTGRRQFRRRRRNELRYRKKRFDNRLRPLGWLPPSLQHRVDTTVSQILRLMRLVPLTALSIETVRFDTQVLENPDIQGAEYQQGTLAGYEVREYLLEKWGRTCSYCQATDIPLEIDHIQSRSKGGSNRLSNLTLACRPCNETKGAQDVKSFLSNKQERLAYILAHTKLPLHDAAAVNSTRAALLKQLQSLGVPVEAASGGQTKYNRSRFQIPKAHALDAACVGNIEAVTNWQMPVLEIKCTGRGQYQRTRLNAFGFPRGYLTRKKRHFGYATGDLVQIQVPNGKKAGCYFGRIAVRASGSFNIQTSNGTVQGISYKHCRLVQRSDGYGYQLKTIPLTKMEQRFLPRLKSEVSALSIL